MQIIRREYGPPRLNARSGEREEKRKQCWRNWGDFMSQTENPAFQFFISLFATSLLPCLLVCLLIHLKTCFIIW